jgi:hypothetical protein
LARKVLAQPTRDFINANGGLRSFWDAEVKVLTDDAARVRTAMRDADPVTRRDLDRQQAAIQKKLAGLNDWANAPVQSKRPDLVEVWAAERRVVITDITQRPFDPAHNFKMSFYIEAIKALTGWTDVSGVEYKSPTVQKTVGSP